MPDRLRTAADIADDIDRLTANIGISHDEYATFAATIDEHQRNTIRIPEMAIQHGANRLHNPDGLPARQLAAHQAACLAIAESVLYGVVEAGYRIVRPPAVQVCVGHGRARCIACRHDGVPHG